MSDAADEGKVIATSLVEGRGDVKQMQIERSYTAPLDGTADQTAAFDVRIARAIAEVLVHHYFGYEWYVMAESRQGIVVFSIPDLMGPTLKWVIKLSQSDVLSPQLIVRCAGEMLERMGLRRGPKDVAEYEAAKLRRHTFDFSDVKQ